MVEQLTLNQWVAGSSPAGETYENKKLLYLLQEFFLSDRWFIMKKSYSSRRYTINTIIIVIGVIFIFRLFYIQVIEKGYKTSADNNVLRYITEYPARGLIYDAKGRLLVFNEATYDLMVIPRQLPESFDTTEFCKLLDIDNITFRKRIRAAINYSSYIPSIFEEKLTKETYGYLQEKLVKFPGFYIQARTIRNYPNPVAAQILGYIGEVTPELLKTDDYYRLGDYLGVSGIEKSYEKELRGRKGVKIIMVDVRGRDKGSYQNGKYDVDSKKGMDLYTFLDLELQIYGELLMKGKRGSIVAIDPATGGILSMVSAPTYDPGLLVGRDRASNYFKLIIDKNLPLFNRALTGKYPPGSTFKTAVGLVAEQEGVLFPNTMYPCYGGFPLGNGKSVGCHSHFSPLNFEQAIQHSCNAYFCKTFKTTIDNKKYKSTREAYDSWRKHIMSFGFGAKLNCDLPNESSGNIPSSNYFDKAFGKNRWRSLSIISLSIGQGEIQLTPLQLANLTAIIANRGFYYTPHIVQAIGTKDDVNYRFSKKHYTDVESKYFYPVVDAMYEVVEAGTARNVKMDSIKVCGKTGTAQNAGKNHSIFIAFAPINNPKIAIAVVVENSGFGATWAAPIASLMIEKYLTHKIKRKDLEKEIIDGKTIN